LVFPIKKLEITITIRIAVGKFIEIIIVWIKLKRWIKPLKIVPSVVKSSAVFITVIDAVLYKHWGFTHKNFEFFLDE